MKRQDVFRVSYGNLEVLKYIPEMMLDKSARKRLRLLVLEYIAYKNRVAYTEKKRRKK